jgi:hypothetical protein
MHAPDGRLIHIWTGRNHEDDIAALASAIAATVPGLVNRGGSPSLVDASGAFAPGGPNVLRDLIGEHICGAQLVTRDGVRVWDYYAYRFAPRPRMGPPTNANPRPDAGLEREPHAEDLDEIFRNELAWRLPKLVE